VVGKAQPRIITDDVNDGAIAYNQDHWQPRVA
jgi:hypothetical protein